MQVGTKATLLVALLLRAAGAVPCPPSFNCLFECCDAPLPPPSEPPACVADGTDGCVPDFRPVTLGVSFTTSEEICLTGVQFYHEAGGTFVTSLWDKLTESNLRTSSVSGSGWLLSALTPPLLMIPGNELVASYTTFSGAYAYQYYYFNGDVTIGPVTFPGGVNGMYAYDGVFYPGEDPYQASNYFVTPVWKPKWSYYVWNTTSDTESFEIYDGFSGCIPGKRWNIEARPNCQTLTTVIFKLYNVNTKKVVKRQTEIEAPFYLWGNEGADVSPSYLLLPNGVYTLYVNTTSTDGETITFTQAC